MKLNKLKTLLEQKAVFVQITTEQKELFTNQDKILIDKDKNIVGLNLANVDLADIFEGIFSLTTLVHLKLSNVNMKEFAHFRITAPLQSLNLNSNQLQELPKEIAQLTSLQSLYLNSNQLQELPKEITQLTSLQSLDLSSNQLQELPKEITQLKRLTSFSVQNNAITNIPKEIISLKVLRSIRLSEEYLIEPYKSSYKRGQESLFVLLEKENSEGGFVELFETKALFVGEPEAGKTSLMELVIDKGYKLKSSLESESTLGIEIKQCTNFKKNNQTITMNMWDFGGQQIQYMTHQFFLTPNSLYLLVADDRKQKTDFDYWFHIIHLLSDDSPILVVLNEKGVKISNFAEKNYKQQFSSHPIQVQEIDLNNMQDGRYDELLEKIKTLLSEMPHIPKKAPQSWVDVKEKINTLIKRQNTLSIKEFRQLCSEHNIEQEKELKALSNYFHDTGVFLHYFDDSELREVIFLNPQWLMQGIYSVLKTDKVHNNNGRFTKEWLFDFWSRGPSEYDQSIQANLLQLMLKDKFEICYKLDESHFIAPQLLGVEPSSDYDFRLETKELHYRYLYPFMPKGIITRLIVRMHDLIYEQNSCQIVWVSGMVLEYKKAKAEIKQTQNKDGAAVIDIVIIGNHQDGVDLLAKIRHELEIIHKKSFESIYFKEQIACNCDQCVKNESPHFFDLETIEKFVNEPKKTMQCSESTKDVEIVGLLQNALNKYSSQEFYQDRKVDDLHKRLEEKDQILKLLLQASENQKAPNIYITNTNQNTNTNNITITITQHFNQLEQDLSSLASRFKQELGANIDTDEQENILNQIKALGENPNKEQIKKSSILNDFKDLYEDSCEKVKNVKNFVSKGKKTIKSLQSLAKTYNGLADFCGLPHVPKFLLAE